MQRNNYYRFCHSDIYFSNLDLYHCMARLTHKIRQRQQASLYGAITLAGCQNKNAVLFDLPVIFLEK